MKNVNGFHRGIVSNIEDPELRGRIKCQIPDILGSEVESAWCEPCVPVAYDNGGDFCLPHIKETVWIAFEEDDPNKPVYLGNWWQKNMTPLGANYADKDKIRIINYADCKIVMKSGIIDINIGAGATDLRIQDGVVTVSGNLVVTGNINCGGKVTSGSVGTGPITASSVNATGTVSASSISASSANITTIDTNTVNASGSVNAPNIP